MRGLDIYEREVLEDACLPHEPPDGVEFWDPPHNAAAFRLLARGLVSVCHCGEHVSGTADGRMILSLYQVHVDG